MNQKSTPLCNLEKEMLLYDTVETWGFNHYYNNCPLQKLTVCNVVFLPLRTQIKCKNLLIVSSTVYCITPLSLDLLSVNLPECPANSTVHIQPKEEAGPVSAWPWNMLTGRRMLKKSVRDRDTALACFIRVKLGKLQGKSRGCIYSSLISDRVHTYTLVHVAVDGNTDICLLSERSQVPESALASGITGKHVTI